MPVDLSVILPVLNEIERINPAIDHLKKLPFDGHIEIIVVDGHPAGTTLNQIKDSDIIKVSSLPGRGTQMNAGADKATGKNLLFLHCDTLLPNDALNAVCHMLNHHHKDAAAFDLRINHPGFFFRIIEKTASLRSRLTKIPYGDQAISIKQAIFFSIGGFKEMPIMEDVDLMRRINKQGYKIGFLNTPVSTSARRWVKEGLFYGTMRNWTIILLFLFGVSPEKLARFYRRHK